MTIHIQMDKEDHCDLADAAAESSRTREELALYERPDGDASGEEEE